ncbi:hypothetical protein GCM10010218_32220 [Streptomyces mashuensis]|uniref:DUF4328 domain-containing protein n=1 Tax=Streptomyces mashuensis TaxID=33904 RepID=A0A919B308_9ACTN|nr:DUF4328 domain-containing protein [Streptomyces mashuensis]GHF48298.1 hypothetical protein GCM10010218_32220 [Streptomyces mashuensis]
MPYPQQPYPQQPMAPYPGPAGMAVPAPAGGIDLRRGMPTTLMVLLGVYALLSPVGIYGNARAREVYDDLLGQSSVADWTTKVNDADTLSSVLGFVSFLVMVPTIILWTMWFYRMRRNAEVFAPGTQRLARGWAGGAWFTPVVNFWFPKQIANDIYRASAPGGPQSAPKGLLNGWWAAWVAVQVAACVSAVVSFVSGIQLAASAANAFADEDEMRSALETMKTGLLISDVACVLYPVAGVLAILVVRQLMGLQGQRLAAGPGAPGVPGGPGAGWQAAPAAPYGAPAAPPVPPAQNPFGNGPAGS